MLQTYTEDNYYASRDLIWECGKIPFPLYLGTFFKDLGKIIPKIHKIGKKEAIF